MTRRSSRTPSRATGKAGPSGSAGRAPIELPGITRPLAITLTRIGRRRIEGEMAIGKDHLNRTGRVNGGALMAFGDVLGARGTVENLPPGYRTTTIESKTNFFAAGNGPVLKAVSIPLHVGRTTMVWQTTVRNLDSQRVAIITQTQIVIPGAPGAPDTAPPAKRRTTRTRTG